MRLFLALGILLFSICGCSTTKFCRDDAPDCLGKIVGTYHGQAFAPGDLQPTLTSFYLDATGELKGAYFINYMQFNKEKKVNYWNGEIINFKPLADYMMWATWHDDSGKGNLRLLFTFDGKEFAGYWGFKNGDSCGPWYGKKVSSKPVITVKDLEGLLMNEQIEGKVVIWPNRFDPTFN